MRWVDRDGQERVGDLEEWHADLREMLTAAELHELDLRAVLLDPAWDLGGASADPPEAITGGRVIA